MIDIHPPHHAATTRRDFFIHIDTIVIGLCIAVGLEQLHPVRTALEIKWVLTFETATSPTPTYLLAGL